MIVNGKVVEEPVETVQLFNKTFIEQVASLIAKSTHNKTHDNCTYTQKGFQGKS